jgi:hypothetical protein
MTDATLLEVRHLIESLHDSRGSRWPTDSEREQYVDLCAAENALLEELRSQGLPIPTS